MVFGYRAIILYKEHIVHCAVQCSAVQCAVQITNHRFCPLAFAPDVFTKTDQRQTHSGAGHGNPVTRVQYHRSRDGGNVI